MKEKRKPVMMSRREYNGIKDMSILVFDLYPTRVLLISRIYISIDLPIWVRVRANFSLSVDLYVIFVFTTCDSNRRS